MIHYATFGRRAWAWILALLIDLFVLAMLQAVARGNDVWAPFLCWLVIHHVALVVEGGTLGHRLAGVRVVRLDGTRVGVLPAIFREVSQLFLSLPPLGLGFLWMLDQPEGRCWHDMIAGTIVVRERSAASVAAPAWADAPPWRARKTSGAEPVVVAAAAPAASDARPPAGADASSHDEPARDDTSHD